MPNSLVTREDFIREMTDEIKESARLQLKRPRAWQAVINTRRTDKRRELFSSNVPPAVSMETEEGGPFNRASFSKGFDSEVIPLSYTLEVAHSGEFIQDLRVREVAADAFGLGMAFQRRRYKAAVALLYNGYSSVTSPDGKPLFSSSHELAVNKAKTASNIVPGNPALSHEAFDTATTMLMQELDENGEILDAELTEVNLIITPALKDEAYKIARSPYDPDNMNNGVNIFAGEYGDYKVNVVILQLLKGNPNAWADSFWVVEDPTRHDLNFWERMPIDTWQIPDPNSMGVLHQGFERSEFHVGGWRGTVASKGDGSN